MHICLMNIVHFNFLLREHTYLCLYLTCLHYPIRYWPIPDQNPTSHDKPNPDLELIQIRIPDPAVVKISIYEDF